LLILKENHRCLFCVLVQVQASLYSLFHASLGGLPFLLATFLVKELLNAELPLSLEQVYHLHAEDFQDLSEISHLLLIPFYSIAYQSGAPASRQKLIDFERDVFELEST